MLGSRLRSWFESQFGRARRRRHKDGGRTRAAVATVVASSPRRHVPPAGLAAVPAPHVHSKRGEDGLKGANLSSPESAYSTGYSTDATLPGSQHPVPPTEPVLQARLPSNAASRAFHHPIIESSPLSVRLRLKEDPPTRFQNSQKKIEVCGRCGTNSPRRRSRIRTNPWLGPGHGRPSQETEPMRSEVPYCGSDGDECETSLFELRDRGRGASPSDGDTGLDGGDEGEPDDSDTESDSERCARARAVPPLPRRRRRRPPRRTPASRSAGTTPLCSRRVAGRVQQQQQQRARRPTPSPPALSPQRAPCSLPYSSPQRVALPQSLLAADREAERKYRELIREAERILHDMKGERPHVHNPRIEQLKSAPSAVENRVFSPKKNHITNFIQNNSTEIVRREPSHVSKLPNHQPRSPSAERHFPSIVGDGDSDLGQASSGWPLSEPMRRKSYAGAGKTHTQIDQLICYQHFYTPDDIKSSIYSPQYPRKAPESQIRRQMLVRTIESLKRSLEEQSDGLQRVHQDGPPY